MIKQLATIVTAGFVGTAASAGVTYNFNAITSNGSGSPAIGEAQLAVEVIDDGLGSVEFYFTNTGTEDAVIAEIYWDDNTGMLTSLDSWSSSEALADVDFGDPINTPSNPANLPSGNNVAFVADFSLEPENPQPTFGVGAGEDVSVFFSYSGGSFGDLIDALDSGELRIGLHVIAFENGASESFTTGTGIPTPTAALAGLAMLGLAGLRRRREDA